LHNEGAFYEAFTAHGIGLLTVLHFGLLAENGHLDFDEGDSVPRNGVVPHGASDSCRLEHRRPPIILELRRSQQKGNPSYFLPFQARMSNTEVIISDWKSSNR
jgi:hypothetical protein